MSDEQKPTPENPQPAEAQANAEGNVAVKPQENVSLEGSEASVQPAGLGLEHLFDIQLDISIELGKTKLPIETIVKLGPGSVITLDKGATEPVDICIRGKKVAAGEVVTIGDNYGIRVTSVLDPAEIISST